MVIAKRTVDERDYLRLRELVTARSGLEFPESRRPQLEAAINTAVEDLGLGDAGELWQRLRDPEREAELEDFIGSLTIGETYFFRNEPHFRALEEHVIPELIVRRGAMRRLRLWSAGCSSGEEAYSLAIVLDRLLPDVDSWDVTIVATDINRNGLRRGREGIYRTWSLRRTPKEIRDRYFVERSDQTWELDPRIRGMVDFHYLNLVDDRYPSLFTNIHAMDVILCRNVLIYFGGATIHTVAEKLYASLADDGVLVVGHAELSRDAFKSFDSRVFPDAILFGKRTATAIPPLSSGPQRDARPRSHRSAPPPKVEDRSSASSSRRRAHPQGAIGAAARHQIDDPVRRLESAAAERPEDPRPAYLLAKLAADRLDTEATTKWIAETLTRDELFAPAHYVAAVMAEEEGRLDDAISALRRCIYADQSWPLPHFVLARCFLKIDATGRARVSLANTVRLLEGWAPDEPIAEGDGLTAGRLLELAKIQADLSPLEPSGAPHGS